MVTKFAIHLIKPNPNNPRLIKDEKFAKLVKSIKEFPQMLELRPIVVNDDMIVLGGNMRLKACKEAGLKEVPIIKASSLTPEQQREFIIKDNVGFGDWDWELIANEWDAEQVTGWGLDIPDFSTAVEGGGDPFDDDGVEAKNQYGVIVMCDGESEQEHIFTRLTGEGYNCKVVVT